MRRGGSFDAAVGGDGAGEHASTCTPLLCVWQGSLLARVPLAPTRQAQGNRYPGLALDPSDDLKPLHPGLLFEVPPPRPGPRLACLHVEIESMATAKSGSTSVGSERFKQHEEGVWRNV